MAALASVEQVMAWVKRNERSTADHTTEYRIAIGSRWHKGYAAWNRADGVVVLFQIRDQRRGSRSQYASVFERHIEAGQVQVRVGERFRDIREAVAEGVAG